MKKDVWKRDLPSAADDCADINCGYEQQLQFNFKPADATPEETEDWQEKELSPWAEKQLGIVAIMSIIQFTMLGLMGLIMMFNQWLFK